VCWRFGVAVGKDVSVPGAIAIVIVLVIAIPVAVLISSTLIAGIIGWVIKDEVDAEYEGTEFLELG
jgi:hypothetical protein